uniref:Uncharacterized protein n=1 Tax=Quercus lobata TaxID=97700 RepID=A0A7N2MRW5_QUELO
MESAILKERDVFFIEMRYSVAKILLSFPIRFIIYASCTMGTMFMLLPHEQVDDSLVPIVVFKDQPIAYHAFLISIMLSFTSAHSSLLIQHKPRVERFCRAYAMVSMISALAILLYATVLWGFRYRPHLAEHEIRIWMEKDTPLYW